MRRPIILAAAVLAVVLTVSVASAQERTQVSGRVEGDLAKGKRIVVSAGVVQQGGFGRISRVTVALQVNDFTLEQIDYEPSLLSLAIPGSRETSTLDDKPLRGGFFEIIPSDVVVRAAGKRLDLRIPIKLLADPSPDSVLTATVRSGTEETDPVTLTGATNLGAEDDGGSSVTTVILAGIVGAIAGATAARRRRVRGPSVFDAVDRRIKESTADEPSPAPAEAAASRTTPERPARKPATRRPAAKRAPARKTAVRKAAPKKSAGRKPAAKKAPAKKAPAKKAPAKKSPAKKSPAKRSTSR